jgi:AhpD family alkylhydroperoxidase
MQARMSQNPMMIVPGALQAMQALQTLRKSVEKQGIVPWRTIDLVQLRVSQINGCSACVEEHARFLKEAGETDARIFAVAAWRDAPYFTNPERAALALAEAVTRIADQPDPVPDTIWNEAARHYDEQELATLVLLISTANLFTRLGTATRQGGTRRTGKGTHTSNVSHQFTR